MIADDERDYGYGEAEAQRFAADAGRAAGRRSRPCSCPAYEDAWYYLWHERRLPVNVDPLEEPPRRRRRNARRLAKVFEQGLDKVVGYALPLRRRRRRRGRAG